MAYTPRDWTNVPLNETPPDGAPALDAANLSRIEDGISAAHDEIDGRLSESSLSGTYVSSADYPGITIDTSVGTRVRVGGLRVYGDTGWRYLAQWDSDGEVVAGTVPAGIVPLGAGGILIRRTTDEVQVIIQAANQDTATSRIDLPSGFGASRYVRVLAADGNPAKAIIGYVGAVSLTTQIASSDLPAFYHPASPTLWIFPAQAGWPATLPGSPA